MDIKRHLKDEALINELAGAGDIRSARAILKAVESLRDEGRKTIETRPQRNDEDLTKDYVYVLGMIAAYNMVLSLPREARRAIGALPEGQKNP